MCGMTGEMGGLLWHLAAATHLSPTSGYKEPLCVCVCVWFLSYTHTSVCVCLCVCLVSLIHTYLCVCVWFLSYTHTHLLRTTHSSLTLHSPQQHISCAHKSFTVPVLPLSHLPPISYPAQPTPSHCITSVHHIPVVVWASWLVSNPSIQKPHLHLRSRHIQPPVVSSPVSHIHHPI